MNTGAKDFLRARLEARRARRTQLAVLALQGLPCLGVSSLDSAGMSDSPPGVPALLRSMAARESVCV